MSPTGIVVLLVEVVGAVFLIDVFFPAEQSRLNGLLKTGLFVLVAIQVMNGLGVLTGLALRFR